MRREVSEERKDSKANGRKIIKISWGKLLPIYLK